MVDLEKIKNRIKALLSKTVENGATKAEMNSALEKANELMLEFFITENDLNREKDEKIINKCVSKSVELIKTQYDLSVFRYNLARLFDCKSYTNTSYVTRTEEERRNKKKRQIESQRTIFFGHETDVELCCYFLQMIERSCMREKKMFLVSFDYMCLRRHTNGKTLVSSFITGFLFEVSNKLDELYKERIRNIPQSYGLMVVDKMENIEKQYKEIELNLKIGKGRKKEYKVGEQLAFDKGTQRGQEFELVQGIGEDDEILKGTVYID